MDTSNKKLLIFWIRLISWITFTSIVPITVFAIKFGLFKKSGYNIVYDDLGNVIQTSSKALNGWGILSCFIVGFMIMSIVKEVVKTYTGYSFVKQCLTGVVNSLIPLAIAFGLCYYLEGVLDNIQYCLVTLMITKVIAIPLNPLPKWRYEKNGVENYNDLLISAYEFLKRKKVN